MEAASKQHGVQFLQKAGFSTNWRSTFQCLSLQERKVSRANERLGIVKCTTAHTITIPPNQTATVPGFVTDTVEGCHSWVMMHQTKKTVLPEGAEVTPALFYQDGDIYGDYELQVEVLNPTCTPIQLQPRATICELQQVQPVEEEEQQSTPQKEEQHEDSDQTFLSRFNMDFTGLAEDEVRAAKELLLKYRGIFSEDEMDIGETPAVKHKIHLVDDTPFKQRHRHIPPGAYQEVREHLKQLLDKGIITRSESPFASAVVLVHKKGSGKLRICVDYRELNRRTIKDAYALPRIEEMLDNFRGCKFFTTLDLRAGYYQVGLADEDKDKTAFTAGPLGFYHFERLPFGLCNAPATFQRCMERTLGDLHMTECFCFIDDLMVPTADFQQQLASLERVFDKLQQNNLKLNPEKCCFFQRKVAYCGHVVSEDGIETDPGKIAAIRDWERPQGVKELRKFLGFAGYYRRFVAGFSREAKPLTELTGGTRRKSKKKGNKPAPATKPWHWGPEQEKAFQTLKEKLVSPPILGYPDYGRPFILYTDASGDGLGAVLSQEQDGKKRVLAYASRGLSKSERNYPAHKLEFLALKWSITDKFKDYLYGHDFTVWTDSNPLTYVTTTAKLDTTGHRWLADLAAFSYNIKYRPGTQNQNADFLSRIPRKDENGEYQFEEVSKESIAAICKVIADVPWVEAFCMSESAPLFDEVVEGVQ